jgi:hypothetical protein
MFYIHATVSAAQLYKPGKDANVDATCALASYSIEAHHFSVPLPFNHTRTNNRLPLVLPQNALLLLVVFLLGVLGWLPITILVLSRNVVPYALKKALILVF